MYGTIKQVDLAGGLKKIAPYVGSTPVWPVIGLHMNPKVQIVGKMEWCQLGSSVKARAAFHIIKQAIESGQLDRSKRSLDKLFA